MLVGCGMETDSRNNGCDVEVGSGRGGRMDSLAGDGVQPSSISNLNDGNDSGMDYRRLIDEQKHELEELKRAAREASPSNR